MQAASSTVARYRDNASLTPDVPASRRQRVSSTKGWQCFYPQCSCLCYAWPTSTQHSLDFFTRTVVSSAILNQSVNQSILTLSNTARWSPMLTPGNMPGPPTRPQPILATMLPYRLGNTSTSNCCGFDTICSNTHGCGGLIKMVHVLWLVVWLV